MDEKIKPYGEMMYFTAAMSHPRLPAQYHLAYAEQLRARVLSRYDELLGSLVGIMED